MDISECDTHIRALYIPISKTKWNEIVNNSTIVSLMTTRGGLPFSNAIDVALQASENSIKPSVISPKLMFAWDMGCNEEKVHNGMEGDSPPNGIDRVTKIIVAKLTLNTYMAGHIYVRSKAVNFEIKMILATHALESFKDACKLICKKGFVPNTNATVVCKAVEHLRVAKGCIELCGKWEWVNYGDKNDWPWLLQSDFEASFVEFLAALALLCSIAKIQTEQERQSLQQSDASTLLKVIIIAYRIKRHLRQADFQMRSSSMESARQVLLMWTENILIEYMLFLLFFYGQNEGVILPDGDEISKKDCVYMCIHAYKRLSTRKIDEYLHVNMAEYMSIVSKWEEESGVDHSAVYSFHISAIEASSRDIDIFSRATWQLEHICSFVLFPEKLTTSHYRRIRDKFIDMH